MEVETFKDFVKSMDDSTKKMIEIGENNWDKVSRGIIYTQLFFITVFSLLSTAL